MRVEVFKRGQPVIRSVASRVRSFKLRAENGRLIAKRIEIGRALGKARVQFGE